MAFPAAVGIQARGLHARGFQGSWWRANLPWTLRQDRLGGNPASQYAGTEECAFQRCLAINASQPGELTEGKKSRYRIFLLV